MQRLVASAICATAAQAADSMKAYRSSRWDKPAHLIEQEAQEAQAYEAQKEKEAYEAQKAKEAIPYNPYNGVMSADGGHNCSFAHDRTKKTITTDLNRWVKGGEKWTDEDFTVQDAIYWDDVTFEAQSLVAAQSYDIYWERACEKWPERSLFGEYGVTPSDTAQGDLGNCWLMAAISAVAEYPERIENLFLNDEATELGKYCINVYSIGVPHTVCVDDYLPFKQNEWTGYENLFYGQVGSNEALWGPLIEKALAKNVGNYWHLDTGINADGVTMLNGSPYDEIRHWDHNNRMTVDDFWDLIKSHDRDRSIMTVKSSPKQGGTFIENHSYVILETLELSTGERLVKLRNPWGVDEYHGKWSDQDDAWRQHKNKRDIPEADDGLFYTSIEEFYNSLESTFINYDTSDWHFGYFMMLNDPAHHNGKDRNCGKSCTRHSLTVTSSVDQIVWIGAHTYRYYSYADGPQCPSHTGDYLLSQLGKTKTTSDNRKNMLFNNKSKTATGWEAGDAWLPKFYMSAGESLEVEIELNWERQGVTKDWSVTAWGEIGHITVTHSDGIKSDSLPYTPKGGSRSSQSSYSSSSPSASIKSESTVKKSYMEDISLVIPQFEPLPTFEFKPDLSAFEIPTLEDDSIPAESSYTPVEAPVFEPLYIPPPKPIEISVGDVIDLDAIDAQIVTTPMVEVYEEQYYEEPTFEDDDITALTDDDGVRKKILVSGQPDDKPKKGAMVDVHYEGRLTDGTVFDSSYERGSPLNFNIGVGRVVEGWDIGIMSMNLGEKAELTIESDYGYGDNGRPPSIPGYATMIFTVELLGINGRQLQKTDPVISSSPAPTPEQIHEKPASRPVIKEESVSYVAPAPTPEPTKEIKPAQKPVVQPKRAPVSDARNPAAKPLPPKPVYETKPAPELKRAPVPDARNPAAKPLPPKPVQETKPAPKPVDEPSYPQVPDSKNPAAKPSEEDKQKQKDEVIDKILERAKTSVYVSLTDDDGVQKKVLSSGIQGLTPKTGDKIYAHYIGRLTDGTVFDSSIKRGKPIAVNIGVGRVVSGWDIAIQEMELGESAALTITADYGYGDRGKEGMVPKGATMQFLV